MNLDINLSINENRMIKINQIEPFFREAERLLVQQYGSSKTIILNYTYTFDLGKSCRLPRNIALKTVLPCYPRLVISSTSFLTCRWHEGGVKMWQPLGNPSMDSLWQSDILMENIGKSPCLICSMGKSTINGHVQWLF